MKNKKGEKTQIIFLYLALSTSQQNTYELYKCLLEDTFNYRVIKELLTTVSWVSISLKKLNINWFILFIDYFTIYILQNLNCIFSLENIQVENSFKINTFCWLNYALGRRCSLDRVRCARSPRARDSAPLADRCRCGSTGAQGRSGCSCMLADTSCWCTPARSHIPASSDRSLQQTSQIPVISLSLEVWQNNFSIPEFCLARRWKVQQYFGPQR